MSKINLHTFVVGQNEFQMMQLDAFTANTYLLKMKGIIGKALSGGLDSDSANLINLIDEKTLNEIIFPLMKDCALTCTSEQVKLNGREGMTEIFSAENLDEFYLVAWEVVKFNFSPFISKMAKNLFGVDMEKIAQIMKEKMKEFGASSSAKISTQNSGSGDQ